MKIAFNNQVDDQLNSIDVDVTKYTYNQKQKIYSDPVLTSTIQQYKQRIQPQNAIEPNSEFELDQNKYHTYNCRLLNLYCICAFDTRNPQNYKMLSFKQTVDQYKDIDFNKQEFDQLIETVNTLSKQAVTDANDYIQTNEINTNTLQIYRDMLIFGNNFVESLFQRYVDKSERLLNILGLIQTVLEMFNRERVMTLDQFKMALMIIKNQKIADQTNDLKQNIYILDSPTGTGKTINFIISSYITSFIQQIKGITPNIGLQSLLFANTDIVAFQTAQSVASNVSGNKYKCGFVEVIINNDFPTLLFSDFQYVNNKWEQQYKMILTMDPTFDISKYPNAFVLLIQSPQYKCIYIANTRYQYINELDVLILVNGNHDDEILRSYIKLIDDQQEIYQFNITEYINNEYSMLSLTLQNHQFLNMFGFIDVRNNIQTVVFDEVDVFYSNGSLEEFYKFYFTQLYNLTATTVIFASATIKSDDINRLDTYISPQLQQQQSLHIQDQMRTMCIQDKFPQIFTIHTAYTVTTIQDLKQIISNLWQQGNLYFYFDIELFKDEPLRANNYCKLSKSKLTIKTDISFVQYTNRVLERFIDHIMPFKRVFVTNKVLRNHAFLPFYCNIDKVTVFNTLETNISNVRDIKLLRKLYIQPFKITVNEPNITQMLNDLIGNKNSLIVTIKDSYIEEQLRNVPTYTKFTQPRDDMNINVYKTIKALQYYKLNERSPFDLQRMSQLSDRPYQQQQNHNNQMILYDDFVNIGRGVDIEGLQNIVLIIPLHYKFDIFKFNEREFTQIIGRVGRFGKPGNVFIVFSEITLNEGDQVNLSPNLSEYLQIGLQQQIIGNNDLISILNQTQASNKQLVNGWIQSQKLQEWSDLLNGPVF